MKQKGRGRSKKSSHSGRLEPSPDDRLDLTDPKNVERLSARALMHATLKHKESAEDFAQWLIVQWLDGKSQHQTIRHAYVDYLKKHYRHLTGVKPKTLVNITPENMDDLVKDDTPDQWDHFERQADIERVLAVMADKLTDYEAMVMRMIAKWGFSQKEIAETIGVTEGRISQVMTVILKKIHQAKTSKRLV